MLTLMECSLLTKVMSFSPDVVGKRGIIRDEFRERMLFRRNLHENEVQILHVESIFSSLLIFKSKVNGTILNFNHEGSRV